MPRRRRMSLTLSWPTVQLHAILYFLHAILRLNAQLPSPQQHTIGNGRDRWDFSWDSLGTPPSAARFRESPAIVPQFINNARTRDLLREGHRVGTPTPTPGIEFQSDEKVSLIKRDNSTFLFPFDPQQTNDGRARTPYGEATSVNRKWRMGSDETVARAYSSLTESKLGGRRDNFDEIYQIFNATMFHLAANDSTGDEDLNHPYPPFPTSTLMLHVDESNFRRTTTSPIATTGGTIADYARRTLAPPSRRQKHSSPAPGTDDEWEESASTPFNFSPTLYPLFTADFKTLPSLGGRPWLEPSTLPPPSDSAETPFQVTDSLMSSLLPTPGDYATTTTTWPPLGESSDAISGQSALVVGQEEYPANKLTQSSNNLYPWERQRGNGYGGSRVMENAVEAETTTISPAAQETLSTLMPFPPPIPPPGGQFYVDQHVSYGQFGRDSNKQVSVVYDPNVLASRYGFKGILAPGVVHTTTAVPYLTDSTTAAATSVEVEEVSDLTTTAPIVYRQLKKIRKPWQAHGARSLQLPISPGSGVSSSSSGTSRTLSRMNLSSNAANQSPFLDDFIALANAVHFPIPPPVKLSTAKAVTIKPYEATSTLPFASFDSANPLGRRLKPGRPSTSTVGVERAATTDPSSTPSRLMNNDHVRWHPLGLKLPEPKSGGVKLVPFNASEEENALAEFESYDGFNETESQACIARGLSSATDLTDLPSRIHLGVVDCFKRVYGCLLHDATPVERRINYSEEQCIAACASSSQCESMSYSKKMAICDIFNARNGTGSPRLLQHTDYRYYEPKMANGRVDICWKQYAEMGGGPIRLEGRSSILVDSKDEENDATSNGGDSATALSSTTPAMPRDMCPGEKDIIVFKSPGHRIRALPSIKPSSNRTQVVSAIQQPLQQRSSETECVFSCLVNLGQGRVPFECAGATYNIRDGVCLLHNEGSDFDGNAHLIPDPLSNHYEKGCMQMELVELCKGYPIVRHPQKTLLGFAMTSRYAFSFTECLEMCFQSKHSPPPTSAAQQQRECKSVMYFYEERDGANCILNFESKDTAPAYFVDENEVLVDYASFENCYHIDDSEPEQWEGLERSESDLAVLDGSMGRGKEVMAAFPDAADYPRAVAIPAELRPRHSGSTPPLVLSERMVSPPKARHPPTVGMLPTGTTSSPRDAIRLSAARRRWRYESAELATTATPATTTTTTTTTTTVSVPLLTPRRQWKRKPTLRKMRVDGNTGEAHRILRSLTAFSVVDLLNE